MGLLRLDVMVTTVAIAAAAALIGSGRTEAQRSQRWRAGLGGAAAVLVAVGTMIKLWPALLAAGAWAIGRRGTAVAMAVATATAGVIWLAVVGDGVEPVRQVLTLRGATGWHVESVPGAVAALVGSEPARLEFNAFRIGTLRPWLVTTGRVVAVAVIAALALVATARRRSAGPGRHRDPSLETTTVVGLVMLGATAALIATAPLLSPQFLIWLTPWGALIARRPFRDLTPEVRAPVVLLAVAVVITGTTLTAFGPPDLDGTIPALLLCLRNLALLAIPVTCLRALAR
jgi:hypothetical protein